MAKDKKKGGCGSIFLSVAVAFFVFCVLITGSKDKSGDDAAQTAKPAAKATATATVKATDAPTATPVPTVDPASMPAQNYITYCTSNNIDGLVYDLVDVSREDEYYAIDLNVGTDYGSSRSFVSSLCVLALKIGQDVFVREDIDQIRLSCFADLRDQYGNLTNLRVFNIFLKRDTFLKINVDYMRQKVLTDPDALLKIADGYSIYSAFRDY